LIFVFLLISSVIFTKTIDLRWEKAEDVIYYILEISKDRDFQANVSVFKPKENNLKIDLKPGIHYLRVAGVGRSGMKGYYSDVRVIEIRAKKKELPPPVIQSTAINKDEVIKKKELDKEIPKESIAKAEKTAVVKHIDKKEVEKDDDEDDDDDVSEAVEIKEKPIVKQQLPRVRLRGLMTFRAYWDSRRMIWVRSY
ncbi:MAG: hypothetical protein OEV44_14195, partial [Spirochaetota bacterium]|nr:hypothetical protein [Spirochaetota bacterium]